MAEKFAKDSTKSGSIIPKLSDKEFRQIAEFVTNTWGIKLPPVKKVMIEGRLRKRLAALNMTSYAEYCDYLFDDQNLQNEGLELIDFVSTNKTDFFRESDHYRYLIDSALPELYQKGFANKCSARIWSAGCSSGEEPYTLAMVIKEFQKEHGGFPAEIMASDISSRVLQIARSAIYKEDKITPIPFEYRKSYLLKAKDHQKKLVRFVPEIRKMVKFQRINLMDLDSYSLGPPFDIIFCRNVIIYFDRPNQEKLVQCFFDRLAKGGFLFMGHSEALPGLKVPFKTVAPMVYQKD